MDITSPQNHRTGGTSVATETVTLIWIPLGAGQRVVRSSGKLYETICASIQRRRRHDLYHSALVVTSCGGRWVIEMAPTVDAHPERRGVVAHGSVGVRWLGRFRVFRYEIRSWFDGAIPDLAEARSVVTMSVDPVHVERVLALVSAVPTPVWGRDELAAGEMWNSNSVTAWLLRSAGIDVTGIHPPDDGRAPGWDAGLEVAARDVTPPCPAAGASLDGGHRVLRREPSRR